MLILPGRVYERVAMYRNQLRVVLSVLALARENEIGLTAAGIGYHLLNSLLPLSVFLVVGFSATGRLSMVTTAIGAVMGIDATGVLSSLDRVLRDEAGRRRAVVIAGVLLVWSSVTLVRAINAAFGAVYNVRQKRSRTRTIIDTVVVCPILLGGVPLCLGTVLWVTVIADVGSERLFTVALVFLTLLGAFLPMYYRFPGDQVTVREAMPGAVFASTSWVAVAVGLGVYASTSETVRLYGITGGVMLLLTSLYLCGLTLLLGAIVNAVLTGHVEVDSEWTPL